MRHIAATALALSLAASASSDPPVRVTAAGSQPSVAGAAAHFSGRVRIDAPFGGPAPARAGGALVTFEPGARTAWHTHPLGQTLIVTSGRGWVQQWGSDAQEIRAGDTVWIPPGVKHWHGASSVTAMAHIAIAESVDGSPVAWLEQVDDSQYSGR